MRKRKATCIEIIFHVLVSQWLRTSEQLDIQPRVKLGVARTGSRTQFVTGMDTLTKDPLENGLFPVLVVVCWNFLHVDLTVYSRGIRPRAWLRWNGLGVSLVLVCGHWVLSFCTPVLGPRPLGFCRTSGRNTGTRWAFSSPLGLVGQCQYRRSVWLCPGVQFYPIPCVCVLSAVPERDCGGWEWNRFQILVRQLRSCARGWWVLRSASYKIL